MTTIIATGCNNTSEQADTPEPETVMVTSERTVEVSAQPSSSGDSTTQSTTETTCEIGQECDLGESSVTVTGVEQTQAISSLSETLEGNFVVIEFDYTYDGMSSTDLDEPPFEFSDGEGNRYSLNFDATSSYGIENDRSLIYETVQPGVPAQGTAIFEVAPNASDFTLLVADLVAPQANNIAEVPLPF